MGIITRMRKQTAVYWGSPVSDGRGGYTYAEGVEVSCRWEDKIHQFVDDVGNNVVSRSLAYVDQDLVVGGWLMLGTLDDVDSAGLDSPEDVDRAYKIQRFDKMPNLGNTEVLRTAYL